MKRKQRSPETPASKVESPVRKARKADDADHVTRLAPVPLAPKRWISRRRWLNFAWTPFKSSTLAYVGSSDGGDGGTDSLGTQGNRLDSDGVRALAKALVGNHSLTSLELSNNGMDGCTYLIGSLLFDHTLAFLDLNYNMVGLTEARGLAKLFQRNTTLNELILEHTAIGSSGAIAVAAALKHNSSLTCLELIYEDIADDGASALAEALQHNSSLRILDVQENNIGRSGGTAPANSLRLNSSVTSLKLGWNCLELDCIVSLAEALQHNSSVTSLDIGNTHIGIDGVVAVAALLKHNSSLTSLNLKGDKIGTLGVEALATVLLHNDSLKILDLADNGIGKDGAVALATVLQKNNSLQYLNLASNPIGSLHHLTAKGRDTGNAGLVKLSAGSCDLLEVPAVLLRYTGLKELDVSDNRLVFPPRQLCERGWPSIRAYLRMAVASGRMPLTRPRLMLLGSGGSGKTTLLAALHALEALDTAEEPRTGLLVKILCGRLETALGGQLGGAGLKEWVEQQESSARDLLEAVVAATEAEHVALTLLETKSLAAAGWARYGGGDKSFWTALRSQGHVVSLGVEQRPLSLGRNGPVVQAVDFAGQPEYFCCHPEFFSTYGALYAVVCPLVAAAEDGHGEVPQDGDVDVSVEDYRGRLRPWLSLLHSSPVGAYHKEQRDGKLPSNTLVMTSFVDRMRDKGGGWRGVVKEVAKEACGSRDMKQVPLVNEDEALLIDYGAEEGADDDIITERLLELRQCLAHHFKALAERDEHPRCFVAMRETVFKAAREHRNGYLWLLSELQLYLMENYQWLSSAITDGMSITEAIDYGIEFLESTGDVKKLQLGEEEMVLIDPIEALSKLLCRFVPTKDGCTCRHCKQLTIALEEANHRGWLKKSVVEELLRKDMTRLQISMGKNGPRAVVEAMKLFGLCYEARNLPKIRRPQHRGGLHEWRISAPRLSSEAQFLVFPSRMGKPKIGDCLGRVTTAAAAAAAAREQELIGVCVRLSFDALELQTFPPSTMSMLQCWLAGQQQCTEPLLDVEEFMCSSRGVAHLATGSVYVELLEPDRKALYVAVFGENFNRVLALTKETITEVPWYFDCRLERLCPECVSQSGENDNAVVVGIQHGIRLELDWFSRNEMNCKNTVCSAGHHESFEETKTISFTISAKDLPLPEDISRVEQEAQNGDDVAALKQRKNQRLIQLLIYLDNSIPSRSNLAQLRALCEVADGTTTESVFELLNHLKRRSLITVDDVSLLKKCLRGIGYEKLISDVEYYEREQSEISGGH